MRYTYKYIYTVVLGTCQGSWFQYNHNAWATIASSVSAGVVTKLSVFLHTWFFIWLCFFSPGGMSSREALNIKISDLKPKRKASVLPYFFSPSTTDVFQQAPLSCPHTLSNAILNILPYPLEVCLKLCNVAIALFISWG